MIDRDKIVSTLFSNYNEVLIPSFLEINREAYTDFIPDNVNVQVVSFLEFIARIKLFPLFPTAQSNFLAICSTGSWCFAHKINEDNLKPPIQGAYSHYYSLITNDKYKRYYNLEWQEFFVLLGVLGDLEAVLYKAGDNDYTVLVCEDNDLQDRIRSIIRNKGG